MIKNTHFFWVLILVLAMNSCGKQRPNSKLLKTAVLTHEKSSDSLSDQDSLNKLKIAQPLDYLNLIEQKVIGVVANQTSVIKNDNGGYTHLIDSLMTLKIKVSKVFSPEHGFRGIADAGEPVSDGKDVKTGLPIISLYGKNKKPSQSQLAGLELIIFDIQDVGVRFYTYLSTLHYVMEACAEAGIPLVVIDRPNPNAHYIDGPVMEAEHRGFLGKHPVPLVYGMTIGEYAQMINGEKWLANNLHCDLKVLPLENYSHKGIYSLDIKPSPNLPNDKAINLYPSLGLFEGTSINAGRGTDMQFQIFGAPFLNETTYPFSYTPRANTGAKYPKQKGKVCLGIDLRSMPRLNEINLEWLILAYKDTPDDHEFFQATFTAHAGSKNLQRQIEQGMSSDQIRKSWESDLQAFKEIRSKYLIYD